MFTKTLLPDTVRAFKLVSKLPSVKKAYLAGGTSLALQIGHRISVDLDFFTNIDFDEKILSQELSSLPEFKEEGQSWKTIWGKVDETKFSFFYYKYPLINDFVEFENINLASLEDISAMKVHALEERGTKRDFIDVYFLSKEFSLDQMLSFYDQKYNCLDDHLYSIIRSLNYFTDAEMDNLPNMLVDISWPEVKKFFEREAVRLGKKFLS